MRGCKIRCSRSGWPSLIMAKWERTACGREITEFKSTDKALGLKGGKPMILPRFQSRRLRLSSLSILLWAAKHHPQDHTLPGRQKKAQGLSKHPFHFYLTNSRTRYPTCDMVTIFLNLCLHPGAPPGPLDVASRPGSVSQCSWEGCVLTVSVGLPIPPYSVASLLHHEALGIHLVNQERVWRPPKQGLHTEKREGREGLIRLF